MFCNFILCLNADIAGFDKEILGSEEYQIVLRYLRDCSETADNTDYIVSDQPFTDPNAALELLLRYPLLLLEFMHM